MSAFAPTEISWDFLGYAFTSHTIRDVLGPLANSRGLYNPRLPTPAVWAILEVTW